MAMLVVACLAYLVVSAGRGQAQPDASRRDLGLARTSMLVTGLCFVQILVGGHVTGLAAGLAYTDFPLMGGAVFPEITSEREAFHAAHRFLAYALVLAVAYLCARAARYRREHPAAAVGRRTGGDPGRHRRGQPLQRHLVAHGHPAPGGGQLDLGGAGAWHHARLP
jgi:heme A synthase